MNSDKAKMWFWVLLDIMIAVAIINVFFFVMPMLDKLRTSFAPTHVITVNAEGKTTATPDIAETSFSVVSQGKDPAALSEDNNKKMNAVVSFVSSKGIADKDVKTTAYDLQPNYQYDKNTGRSTIFGYTLTQTITIKIRDLTKVADILAGLAPLGVNQIGGVNFTFDDPEKFVALAREDAIRKVREKARDMAASAGTSLGSIVTISENANTPIPYFYKASAESVGMGGVAAPTAPPIQPGSQDITDNVSITYELR